jgi:hypothetical protein
MLRAADKAERKTAIRFTHVTDPRKKGVAPKQAAGVFAAIKHATIARFTRGTLNSEQ